MKETFESYNSVATTGSNSKDFLVPSLSQSILYFLISILLLIAFNLGHIWNYLYNTILSPDVGIGSVMPEHASTINRLLNTLSHSIILQVVFWVCIGVLIYIFIWFMRNVVINILNDVVADNYIHPAAYNRFNYWGSVIVRKIFFGASLVVLLFYFFASWKLVGSLAIFAYKAVTDFIPGHSLLELGGILLLVMVLIHTLILITHITLNSWRFIYRDL